MNDITIFKDCGLQEIQFVNFGKDILIKFNSSYNGEHIGSLLCRDIILFKYSDPYREYIDASLSEIDKGFFSSFIGCIIVEKISDYYKVGLEPIEENITIHCLEYEVV